MRDFLDRVSDEVSDGVGQLRDTVFGTDDDDSDLPEILQDDDGGDFDVDDTVVSAAIIDQFDPDSVFDIGCGSGIHIRPFLDRDIPAAGVDETNVAKETAVVPRRRITIRDLTEPFDPGKQYDIVLCLDMLEYTSPGQEDALITTVANATGGTAVVSVPLPRYSNIEYTREEPEDYWVHRFREHGLVYDREATDTLQERIDADDAAWVPEQLMVFRATDQDGDTT